MTARGTPHLPYSSRMTFSTRRTMLPTVVSDGWAAAILWPSLRIRSMSSPGSREGLRYRCLEHTHPTTSLRPEAGAGTRNATREMVPRTPAPPGPPRQRKSPGLPRSRCSIRTRWPPSERRDRQQRGPTTPRRPRCCSPAAPPAAGPCSHAGPCPPPPGPHRHSSIARAR